MHGLSKSRATSSYPSTLGQLAVVLSMLHCPSSESPEVDPRLVLSAPPTFIILHEMSSLFADPELVYVAPSMLVGVVLIIWKVNLPRLSESHRAGSGYNDQPFRYAGKVRTLESPSRALDLKDDRNVNLVWFDSKLQNLMLPALPKPDYVNEADEKYYEPISVGKMAEKYFEWVGEVSVGERA